MDPTPDERRARRGFLQHLAGATTVAPLTRLALGGGAAAATAEVAAATVPAPVKNTVYGYLSFSGDEAAFVEALVALMCPADAMTPDGVDCGLAIYIDRQLAGDFGKGARRYARGPWLPGKPQHGEQLPLVPEQHFRIGLAAANAKSRSLHGKPFDQLAGADADGFLNAIAAGQHDAGAPLSLATWFNEMVYPLFIQACFADPVYGGNVGKVFWKMIGYPGLPATHTLDVRQYRGKPYPGAADPKSIADFA